jgi:hypothetical protein
MAEGEFSSDHVINGRTALAQMIHYFIQKIWIKNCYILVYFYDGGFNITKI